MTLQNQSRICVIYLLSILLAFSTSYVLGENVGVNSGRSSDVEKGEKPVKTKPTAPVPLKRIKEVGGEVVVDGSMRVLEPIMGKVFDLVETSTPVTPSVNHVRIFAVSIGTATAVKAIFDDGRIIVITNN